MSDKSKISWTEATWNPVVGCTKVSAGCENCYAERMGNRQASMACAALATKNRMTAKQKAYTKVMKLWHDPQNEKTYWRGWNGKVECIESELDKPLHWKKPRRIFVNSMSDLFHPGVPSEFIDRVMAAISAYPQQHTYQILTKRPEIMGDYIQTLYAGLTKFHRGKDFQWPFKNLWLGTTIENQDNVSRLKYLLQIPAAVRFVSVEPMLGSVDFGRVVSLDNPLSEFTCGCNGRIDFVGDRFPERRGSGGAKDRNDPGWETCCGECGNEKYRWNIHQVIIGCESGPKRRPCKIEWVRDLVAQCDAAKVAVFVKQLDIDGKVSKNPEEWPEDLRRQEYPKEQ